MDLLNVYSVATQLMLQVVPGKKDRRKEEKRRKGSGD